MERAKEILKKYYGYDDFRYGQRELIKSILQENDTLGIMPTGAGKSICYQVPALILPGVTLVISPLISLMKDQVDNLNELGIPSAFINSTLTSKRFYEIINNAINNRYKLIYIAPERLETQSFINILNKINISMISIDEAHCVSQWGHDFRKSYTKIADIISMIEKRPIISAFTATATEKVEQDIINLLKLKDPFRLVTGFDRENLFFSVEKIENKKDYIVNYIEENKENSGIIYCSTRKSVDMLYEKLSKLGYKVTSYHAGMR